MKPKVKRLLESILSEIEQDTSEWKPTEYFQAKKDEIDPTGEKSAEYFDNDIQDHIKGVQDNVYKMGSHFKQRAQQKEPALDYENRGAIGSLEDLSDIIKRSRANAQSGDDILLNITPELEKKYGNNPAALAMLKNAAKGIVNHQRDFSYINPDDDLADDFDYRAKVHDDDKTREDSPHIKAFRDWSMLQRNLPFGSAERGQVERDPNLLGGAILNHIKVHPHHLYDKENDYFSQQVDSEGNPVINTTPHFNPSAAPFKDAASSYEKGRLQDTAEAIADWISAIRRKKPDGTRPDKEFTRGAVYKNIDRFYQHKPQLHGMMKKTTDWVLDNMDDFKTPESIKEAVKVLFLSQLYEALEIDTRKYTFEYITEQLGF